MNTYINWSWMANYKYMLFSTLESPRKMSFYKVNFYTTKHIEIKSCTILQLTQVGLTAGFGKMLGFHNTNHN